MSWELGASWSELEQAGVRGVSWSKLGASWSELGASWSEGSKLGVSWSKGSELERAGSELE